MRSHCDSLSAWHEQPRPHASSTLMGLAHPEVSAVMLTRLFGVGRLHAAPPEGASAPLRHGRFRWLRNLRVAAALLPALLPWLHASAAAASDTYEVQAGDTLSVIAERTGIDMETLIGLNGIDDPSLIVVGAVLQ